MVDFIKSFFESWNERIRSPFLSSFTVVFFALNWRGLFVLFFSEMTAVDRIAYFESHTSTQTLLLYPLLGGLALPFIFEMAKLFSAWSIKWPENVLYGMKGSRASDRRVTEYVSRKDEEVRILEAEARHEAAVERRRELRENVALGRAERDKEAQKYGVDLKSEFDDIRTSEETVDPPFMPYDEEFPSEVEPHLTRIEQELLKFFVEFDFSIPAVTNPITLMEEERKSKFSRLFPTALGENSARMEVELSHALRNLMSEGVLEKVTPGGGGEYTVTKLGYDYYDRKLAGY